MRRAQSTLEYSVLIAIVVAAIAAMHTYVQRSVQANLKTVEEQVNASAVPYALNPGGTASAFPDLSDQALKDAINELGLELGRLQAQQMIGPDMGWPTYTNEDYEQRVSDLMSALAPLQEEAERRGLISEWGIQ